MIFSPAIFIDRLLVILSILLLLLKEKLIDVKKKD
jgi:hypothetical protein